ncbi:MAG TPA: ABC transporter permease subunit [Myxococcota bacterium]|nr:ABC transporter permease subunit [Myxococcota bacterium]
MVADRVADWSISIGGLAVIAAVFGIMAFLVEVVVPLFAGGSVESAVHYALPAPAAEPSRARPLALASDEYGSVGVVLHADGGFESFHLGSGRLLEAGRLELGSVPVTAAARTPRGGHLILGFADGSVRFGRIDLAAEVVPLERLPVGLAPLPTGERTDGRAVYGAIPGGDWRRVAPVIELQEAKPLSTSGRAIVAADVRVGGSAERPSRSFVGVDDAGAIFLARSQSRTNMMSGAVTVADSRSQLPSLAAGRDVAGVLLTERGEEVIVAERDGTLHRYDVRDFARPVVAEVRDVAPGPAEITSLGFLIGEQGVAVGTSEGAVNVWFRVERRDAGTTDGRSLVLAHSLEPQPAAVVAFAPSQRSKGFATGDAAGNVWLRHATSERVLLRLEGVLRAPVQAVALTPRDDGVVALSDAREAAHWQVRVPHPETTLRTIFRRVWYEGYPEPGYTWQSSSGTDVFEPKFSLVPLVFGTLKATFYSLLFAVPVALLAAVYTSEFVHPRVRNAVKPTMEMMASLPSVVLGFLAALVLAPVVERWLGSVLLALATVPLALLGSAYLWQLLPRRATLRLEGLPKLALVFAALALGAFAALAGGGAFERVFFGGDVRLWLDGGTGRAAPVLALLLYPFALVGVGWLFARGPGAGLAARVRALEPPRAALADAALWLGRLAAAGAVAAVAGFALEALGVDPRGSFLGTYVQRNTLVVGFAMGFAVIPIIYTIAEDALSAVPAHLRAASLACGATPWQTAISVIVPTAMSGIFAAIMIGMGRAVGETMIVVMAAGNTPILDLNVFNGFRALSANIAVELPEAVKDGSLYRMLFLAALTLFAMTFVVNTVAELVRLRFRRRAAEL